MARILRRVTGALAFGSKRATNESGRLPLGRISNALRQHGYEPQGRPT